jgi:hypothetical protein
MKYFQLLFTFFIIILQSCNNETTPVQSNSSLQKLDSLHSGFNEVELTKQIINNQKDTVVIVAFGHLYGMLSHTELFEQLINVVNEQKPDYVWVLGDIVYNNTEEEWDTVLSYYQNFDGIRYHAGGNHDMNYHYERYFGVRENQWEAESRYLDKVGYRYLTLEDNVANYMLINMNDSIDRIDEYLSIMLPELNPDKPSVLFTHQAVWHENQSDADDPKTWVKKSFPKDTILSRLGDFDYLVHGDWAQKFYFNTQTFNGIKYYALAAGNYTEGEPIHITRIELSAGGMKAEAIPIPIPENSTWNKKSP